MEGIQEQNSHNDIAEEFVEEKPKFENAEAEARYYKQRYKVCFQFTIEIES